MSHIQFTRDSRVELAALLFAGKNQGQCADVLGMYRSSIKREVDNNQDEDGIYRGGHAHKRAMSRRKIAKQPKRKIENDRQLREYIIRKLKGLWSPEQIAGRLRRLDGDTVVCMETIYTFVYEERPDLVRYLRRQRNKYRKKRGSWARILQNKDSKIRRIGERPNIVETRSRIGDWEGDTVVGKEKKQRILTYVERMSGFGIGNKLDAVTAELVQDRTIEIFKNIPAIARKTLTRDNGPEFGDLDFDLEQKTKLLVYRAKPYCSSERGTNENWNGLLRQFFPKGTYFATITQVQVRQAVRLLNNRPRKRLSYATPREIFNSCCNSS